MPRNPEDRENSIVLDDRDLKQRLSQAEDKLRHDKIVMEEMELQIVSLHAQLKGDEFERLRLWVFATHWMLLLLMLLVIVGYFI